jgi:hypothetical protein
MELNAMTSRLLEKVRDNKTDTARVLLEDLARELGMEGEAMLTPGSEQLRQLVAQSVVLVQPH